MARKWRLRQLRSQSVFTQQRVPPQSKATLLTRTYRKGIGYGGPDRRHHGISSRTGEFKTTNAMPHPGSHCSRPIIFFCRIRRCLERLPQPPKRFHYRIDIKRTLYINFIYIKIFRKYKAKAKKIIATIENQQHQNYCRDYLNSLGRLMSSKDNILESLPHPFYCNRLPYGLCRNSTGRPERASVSPPTSARLEKPARQRHHQARFRFFLRRRINGHATSRRIWLFYY